MFFHTSSSPISIKERVLALTPYALVITMLSVMGHIGFHALEEEPEPEVHERVIRQPVVFTVTKYEPRVISTEFHYFYAAEDLLIEGSPHALECDLRPDQFDFEEWHNYCWPGSLSWDTFQCNSYGGSCETAY